MNATATHLPPRIRFDRRSLTRDAVASRIDLVTAAWRADRPTPEPASVETRAAVHYLAHGILALDTGRR